MACPNCEFLKKQNKHIDALLTKSQQRYSSLRSEYAKLQLNNNDNKRLVLLLKQELQILKKDREVKPMKKIKLLTKENQHLQAQLEQVNKNLSKANAINNVFLKEIKKLQDTNTMLRVVVNKQKQSISSKSESVRGDELNINDESVDYNYSASSAAPIQNYFDNLRDDNNHENRLQESFRSQHDNSNNNDIILNGLDEFENSIINYDPDIQLADANQSINLLNE